MNVFIVTQTFPPAAGGMQNVMASLAELFAETGYTVTVLPNKAFEGSYPYSVVHEPALKFRRAIKKRRYLAAHLSDDDLVICDSWKSIAAVPQHSGRLLVLAHGQEYLKSGRRARRIQKALNRVTHLVASSFYTLDLVEASWQTNHVKKTMIPPSYMLDAALPTPVAKSGKPLRLVSICRLEARKGLLQSLRALARLNDALPEWRWDIGGNGPQQDELASCIAALGLNDRVFLLGRVDEAEKNDLLAAADLFIMPSYQEGKSLEGFGISYVEAARFGVPSIAGLAGGAPEAVIDGQTGWCVDVTQRHHLDETLTAALGDLAERSKRGKAAQDNFMQRFAGSISFGQFLDLIDN